MSADHDTTPGRDGCDWCGADASVSFGTVTDDSGGSLVRLCDGCRAVVGQRRCGLCGDVVDPNRKADDLYFHDETEERNATPICDDCRVAAVFEPGAGREVRR